MSDVVRIERLLKHPLERVFEFFSKEERLMSWFGPEGLHVTEGSLAFENQSSWFSVMTNGEGQRYKVSGQVTSFNAPTSIGFTWGWHDEQDNRGDESFVLVEFEAVSASETRLKLSHSDISDQATRDSHAQGWNSSLNSLETALAA